MVSVSHLILGLALCFVYSGVEASRPGCGYFGPSLLLNDGTTTQAEAPEAAISVSSFHNEISPWTIGCQPSWASCVDQNLPDEASTSYYTFDEKTNLLSTSKENSSYKDLEKSYQWASADNLLEAILLGGTVSEFNQSVSTTTEHDDQNRLTKEGYTSSIYSYDVTLNYEDADHPMLATSVVVNISGSSYESDLSYEFNSDGLISQNSITNSGLNSSNTFYYDDNKNLIAVVDDTGSWNNYTYSSDGRLQSLITGSSNVTIAYNNDQLDTIVENFNGDVVTCTFHDSSSSTKVLGTLNKPAQRKRATLMNFFNPLQRIKHINQHKKN